MKHRWNSIGRTRIKLAAILTSAIRADGAPVDVEVHPSNISAMRLVGKARLWEDAHSWEAFPSQVGDPHQSAGFRRHSLYSYSTMTDIVRAGGIEWIGKDGECIAATPRSEKRS